MTEPKVAENGEPRGGESGTVAGQVRRFGVFEMDLGSGELRKRTPFRERSIPGRFPLALEKHGFEVVFKETDGGHTWKNWREYLAEFAPQLFR